MAHEFCPGYPGAFAKLVASYPDSAVYPTDDFRLEWGPIFHRGRLDGSARILVIGQDPAAHETVVRRVLVGEAGQRVQGLLWKLGIERSYVFINAFLYSVYGSTGNHVDDPGIVAYRNQWIDAVFAGGNIEAVLALGGDAVKAYSKWKSMTAAVPPHTFAKIVHPTADAHTLSTSDLLKNWNASGLKILDGKVTPDVQRAVTFYGASFTAADLKDIPERDLPPGLPAWMRALDSWAVRPEIPSAPPRSSAEQALAARYKRRHIIVAAPETAIP